MSPWNFLISLVASLFLGATVQAPAVSLPAPAQAPPPPPSALHGIYLTASTAVSATGEAIMDELVSHGGNMIVFDIQSGSKLAYQSNLPLSIELNNRGTTYEDLPAFVKKVHDKGIYAVARFVLFKNGHLAAARPDWTIKARGTNRPFSNRDGAIWLDPGNEELVNYYASVVTELAEAGFDEVQFDYVRFPEAGKGGYVGYTFTGENNTPPMTRDQAVTAAVATLSEALHARGVAASVDVFGIVVWDNISWKLIGQNTAELAKHVDAMYPMPYPSHFGPGWGGHENPADEPYFFVHETLKKFQEQIVGTNVKLRPWLQGFNMRVTKGYGPQYIKEQIRAGTDLGIDEYAVWNASNNYGVSFPAF